MPISVKATFAQEGVFFAGEKLSCTITFTNSATDTNGQHSSLLPPRSSTSLQHKLPVHHEQGQHESNSNEQRSSSTSPTSPLTMSMSSFSSPLNASSPRLDTITQSRPTPSLMQNVSTLSINSNLHESGARSQSRPDVSQQRPATAANRALSQTRVSSDINHIDAFPQRNTKEHQDQKQAIDQEQEEQEEQEQTIPAPARSDGNTPIQSPDSPKPRMQIGEHKELPNVPKEDSQQSTTSPSILGLASFVYRSASFSSLASAFGLSGGDPESTLSLDERKLPPLPPPDHLDSEKKSSLNVLPPVQIMSPENDEERTTKESIHGNNDLLNGGTTKDDVDPDQLARMGTPIGLGLGAGSSGQSRASTDTSQTGLNEGMIELQVTDNADTQSVADDSEYQTPRPSMDYSTRSSMQSVRGPFHQQSYASPSRRSSIMSNYSIHSSPRSLQVPGQGSKKESLLWGSIQVVGQFMVDGSFIQQQGFESLKTKTMYRPTGSSGGGAIGGGTLGTVNTSDWRDRANASRLFPVFSTPPSILFVDLQLAPGESISYTYQIDMPADLPPSHRGKTIRFAYNLVVGVQRGSVHTPAKSVQLPFRLYNNISELGTRPVYDLMSPVILHKDTAISNVVGQERTIEKSNDNPQQGRKQFEDYVAELIKNIKPNDEEFNPTQARELTRRESDAYKDEEAILSRTCLEKVALLSRSTSAASYDICKNNVPVAKLSLIKTRFKLGETVHGVLSFSVRKIPTYQISITLETIEAIEPTYACRSAAQTAKLTRRIHAELHESCIDTMRTSFALCIPPTATPEFKTSTLTLKWCIRVEFITGLADQPRFKMTSVDERRSQYQAVESLPTESFDCTVPIQVYPTSYETGSLFPSTVSFSLA
ncbi:hypothetical protein BGZ46_009269 [Entomortierella lignicola]|nr:hypothetical protein BGZ46_009269 [Entomortierella lignicola]